jgi:DNA-directed RNA polymerase subunit RPC12/RpoP
MNIKQQYSANNKNRRLTMSTSHQKPAFEGLTTHSINGAEVVINQEGQLTRTYLCPECHIPMQTKDILQGVRCPDCGHSVTFDKLKEIHEILPNIP